MRVWSGKIINLKTSKEETYEIEVETKLRDGFEIDDLWKELGIKFEILDDERVLWKFKGSKDQIDQLQKRIQEETTE